MNEAKEILGHWLGYPHGATIESLGNAGGFSGARLWRITNSGNDYVLRKWPRSAGSARRINQLGEFQRHLAAHGLPVPQPVALNDGSAVFAQFDASGAIAVWTLTNWLPGVADYHEDPSHEKLVAACTMLASLHWHAAKFNGPDGERTARIAPSPAMLKRIERLNSVEAELLARRRAGFPSVVAAERDLAREATQLIEAAAPRQRGLLEPWRAARLPLQWRLGDIWNDHVLFTGNQVTGIIDFGAAGIDSPAGDVARLLGSMVGDDPDRWRAGLAAYESIRPLSDLERQALNVFDSTGTVAAAANWLAWLWPARGTAAGHVINREAALVRLRGLNARLARLPMGPP